MPVNKSRTNPTSSEIKALGKTISKTHLLRLAGLSDIIDRFIDIQLKDRVNWLKTFTLIILTIHDGSSTPSELGRIMLRPKENMTKIIDDLAKEGLVKRSRRSKDRRTVQIKLTSQGFNYMKEILKEIRPEEKLITEWLDPLELEILEKVSDKFSTVLNGKGKINIEN